MELDLRDYMRIIGKRIWMIVAIVLIVTVATAIASYYYIQPVYEASTKLIVNKSDDQTLNSQVDLNSINTNISLINTYKEIIKTPAIMDKVLAAYPQFHLTSDELSKKVSVSSVNNTQVMTLAVQDRSYTLAAQIVNAVSVVFKEQIPLIMKVDNVSLLNQASMTDVPLPVKPNKKLNIALGFIVSLMVSIGIVFLLEYMDDTLKTEADVEQYLGLATLGMISKMKTEDLRIQPETVSQTQPGKIGGEQKHASINR